MRIFLVAFLKYTERGTGFERIHLQTFYPTLEEAKKNIVSNFCDDAGWYNGALIEEIESGNREFTERQRVFYLQSTENGLLVEIPEPEYCKNIVNLI